MVPPQVIVDPNATRELENSTLLELYTLVGRSVADAEGLLGYPDRLAGALTNDGVVVLEASTGESTGDKARIVTGFCWKPATAPLGPDGRSMRVADRLTLVTVDASAYQPGTIRGEGGFNDFPSGWAARRECDTNPSLMIPVLTPHVSSPMSPGATPTS